MTDMYTHVNIYCMHVYILIYIYIYFQFPLYCIIPSMLYIKYTQDTVDRNLLFTFSIIYPNTQARLYIYHIAKQNFIHRTYQFIVIFMLVYSICYVCASDNII